MSQHEGIQKTNKRRHSEMSLVRSETCLLSDVSSSQQNVSDDEHKNSFSQHSLSYKRLKINKDHLHYKDVTNGNLLTSLQIDDSTLLDAIKSADLSQATKLLKEDHPFSQNGIDRALVSASCQGLTFLVQKLVRLGANVEARDKYGNTPLLICAENVFIDIVHFLLMRKADVKAFNAAGDTALILSMRASGSSTIVMVLLAQKGVDINHQNQDGYTALMKAIEVKDVRTVKMLLDEYYKIDLPINRAVNCKGETAQQIAARCGLGKVVEILNKHDREVLPLIVAVDVCDTETFNILLDCQFIDESEMKASANAEFSQIFTNYETEKVKTIECDEIVTIRRLLECGADVVTNEFNKSLVVAVDIGNYQLVELLCQNFDQHQQLRTCSCGTEALTAAAEAGRCDLIKLLLHYQAYVNQDDYFYSPLDCALNHGHLECAQLLVHHGARMDVNRALSLAVREEAPEYMNFLIHNFKPDILNYAVNNANLFNNILLVAVRERNLEIIEHLLDAGADINHVSFSKKTPLGESNSGEVAKFLVSKGANVNQETQGMTPLLSVLLGPPTGPLGFTWGFSAEVVKVLLDNGSSFNVRCSDGRTPLIVAASTEGSVVALQALLDHGAGFIDQDRDGNTALIEAVRGDCLENVAFLLRYAQEKKHCLNVQNELGRSALMCAVKLIRVKMVKLLIDHGADVNIKDKHGNTALLLSVPNTSRYTKKIMTALIAAGSDVNLQSNEGFSPLMIAAENHNNCAISILLDSGAEVNGVSIRDNTTTALTILTDLTDLTDKAHLNKNAIFALKTLLRRGASASHVLPVFLYVLISQEAIDVVYKLIQRGLAPFDLNTMLIGRYLKEWRSHLEKNMAVSPLRVALMAGNVPLAQYFVKMLFLTNCDMSSSAGDRDFRCHLEKKKYMESLNFFNEFFSQPRSLFQLAFVSVSSFVGTSPGRGKRVSMMPITEVVKEKLLFESW